MPPEGRWDGATFSTSAPVRPRMLLTYMSSMKAGGAVKVPANFVVWGTGTLANAAEVLQPTPLARLQASMTSDTTVRVAVARTPARRPGAWFRRRARAPPRARYPS